MIKWTTIIAALCAIPLTLWAVQASTVPPPVLAPDEAPPLNPFKDGIAAPGTVEASSRNVRIAAPEPGQVARVLVRVNQLVKAGDPLFQLDARLIEAELAKAEAAVAVADRELERLRGLPRPEDVARLAAALDETIAKLDHRRREHDRVRRLHLRGAVSDQELNEAALALNVALTGRSQAQTELDRVPGRRMETRPHHRRSDDTASPGRGRRHPCSTGPNDGQVTDRRHSAQVLRRARRALRQSATSRRSSWATSLACTFVPRLTSATPRAWAPTAALSPSCPISLIVHTSSRSCTSSRWRCPRIWRPRSTPRWSRRACSRSCFASRGPSRARDSIPAR